MTPTPRLAVALAAISVAAIALPLWICGVAALILVGAGLADACYVRKRPDAQLTLPKLIARGVPADFALTLGALPAGATARVRQPLPPDVGLTPSTGAGDLIGHIVAKRRGRHVLPKPAIRVEGPLRLGAWTHRIGDETEVVVYPDVYGAARIAAAVRSGRFQDASGAHRGPIGLGTEFESIRDYQPDDDIRQVNWLATARSGRTMSNTYRLDQDRTVVCLVDAGRLMAAPIDGRTRLDAAIDAAIAVASCADEVGDAIGALAFDGEIRRQVSQTRRGSRNVIQALFDLEPSMLESDYELAFRSIGSTKRSLVVVFTDLLDDSAARTLIDAVPVVARRHAVIIASVIDADLHDLLRRPPQSTADAAEQAAAADLIERRLLAVSTLRRAGAVVIEAEADALPTATVSAYLRLKRAARI